MRLEANQDFDSGRNQRIIERLDREEPGAQILLEGGKHAVLCARIDLTGAPSPRQQAAKLEDCQPADCSGRLGLKVTLEFLRTRLIQVPLSQSAGVQVRRRGQRLSRSFRTRGALGARRRMLARRSACDGSRRAPCSGIMRASARPRRVTISSPSSARTRSRWLSELRISRMVRLFIRGAHPYCATFNTNVTHARPNRVTSSKSETDCCNRRSTCAVRGCSRSACQL